MWKPHPGFQTEFLRRAEFEAFAGGSVGPGKTDLLIVGALEHIDHPKYHGLILRRTVPRLQEIIDRCMEMYPQFGGIWKAGITYSGGSITHSRGCISFDLIKSVSYGPYRHTKQSKLPSVEADGNVYPGQRKPLPTPHLSFEILKINKSNCPLVTATEQPGCQMIALLCSRKPVLISSESLRPECPLFRNEPERTSPPFRRELPQSMCTLANRSSSVGISVIIRTHSYRTDFDGRFADTRQR